MIGDSFLGFFHSFIVPCECHVCLFNANACHDVYLAIKIIFVFDL